LTRAVPVTWLLGSMLENSSPLLEPPRAAAAACCFACSGAYFEAPGYTSPSGRFNAARPVRDAVTILERWWRSMPGGRTELCWRLERKGGAASGPIRALRRMSSKGGLTCASDQGPWRCWWRRPAAGGLRERRRRRWHAGHRPAPAGKGHGDRDRLRQAGQLRRAGPAQARGDPAGAGQQHQGAGRDPDRPAGRRAHPGRVLPGHRDRGGGADPELAARLRRGRRDVGRPAPQRGRGPQAGEVFLVLGHQPGAGRGQAAVPATPREPSCRRPRPRSRPRSSPRPTTSSRPAGSRPAPTRSPSSSSRAATP